MTNPTTAQNSIPSDDGREPDGPVVRDKRRIDPETGAVRIQPPGTAGGQTAPTGAGPEAPADTPAATAAQQGAPGTEADANTDALLAQLSERTADLQRVTAEYANYRRRVDRDRMQVQETAVASVLSALLPVLDDIGRARQHGELEGGFKAVAEAFEGVLSKFGLESFGAEGDPFDPNVHEALMHQHSADVTEPTCVMILALGYRMGERILRPARVAVADPDA